MGQEAREALRERNKKGLAVSYAAADIAICGHGSQKGLEGPGACKLTALFHRIACSALAQRPKLFKIFTHRSRLFPTWN